MGKILQIVNLLCPGESIRNNLSRLTLAIWLCVIVVVTASYTAVLSSMMTVPRLKPSIVDIDYLKNSNATVGCNGKGFVVKYLLETLKFNRANIKKIASISDYPEAFEKGQISAAFLISPHAKVFVAKNKRYVVAKPSFEVGGLAFVRFKPMLVCFLHLFHFMGRHKSTF